MYPTLKRVQGKLWYMARSELILYLSSPYQGRGPKVCCERIMAMGAVMDEKGVKPC